MKISSQTVVRSLALAPFVLIIAALLVVIGIGKVTGIQAMAVLSGSMETSIPTGALVLLMPIQAADVRVGDVITFTPPGRSDTQITHRVVGFKATTGPRQWVTQGDANVAPDAWTIPAQGKGSRVVLSVPALGSLLQFAHSAAFRVPAIGLPAISLLVMFALRLTPKFRRQIAA